MKYFVRYIHVEGVGVVEYMLTTRRHYPVNPNKSKLQILVDDIDGVSFVTHLTGCYDNIACHVWRDSRGLEHNLSEFNGSVFSKIWVIPYGKHLRSTFHAIAHNRLDME